jgi:DNA-binding transcriptional MerR regulator
MARASAKSPEAFRTISEAADVLDLPQHVLRFWETRFSQIKPMKRSGGRRYYRPSDIALLQGIRHLLYDEGYTIKGVQRILREQGIAHVVSFADQTVAGPPANPPAARPVPAPQPVAPTIGPAPDPPQISTPQTSLEPARPDPVRAALSGRTEPAPSAQPVTQQAPASPPVAAPPAASTSQVPSPPVVPTTSNLRFVAEPEPTAVHDEALHASTPQSAAPPTPQLGAAPSQPLPQPVAAGVAPPSAPFTPSPVPPAATPAPTAAAQPLPQATRPPGAAEVGGSLSPNQTEALVQALRTLMECKSQLDQARPTPTPAEPPSPA